jgi:uncharacterized protein YaeQ
MEYRIALSHVDRGIDFSQTVIAAHHPSETAEHLTLRVLAYCLRYEEGIAFGPGLSDPEAADLWARDPTGRLLLWVECGSADPQKLRRVLQHHSGAAVHAVFGEDRRREEMLSEAAEWKRAAKGFDQIGLWTVDRALVSALSAQTERRQRWAVTVVGDHFYIDADGKNLEGAVARASPLS